MLTKEEKALVVAGLRARARYTLGEPVHWRGAVYRITARYYRRSIGWILYDMKEVVESGSPRYQSKRREEEIEPFKRE